MLKQKLQADQLAAMKARNQAQLDTIRYIVSQIKNKEIALQHELNDEEVLSVLQKVKKELNESIESFQKGNRADLVGEYQAQLDVVSQYLPKELTDAELDAAVSALIESNREAYEKNPKSIIGICMKGLRGKAESGPVKQ
jgi:uncharacterized protein YqeY